MAKKLSKKINKTLNEYIKVIKDEIPVERVIVFGSYARGKANKKSDIDVCIVSPKFGKNPHEEGKFLFRKLWQVKRANIDPVGYSPGDFKSKFVSPLLYEIKKYGLEYKF
jgi:predicted nucleotidyltransferase